MSLIRFKKSETMAVTLMKIGRLSALKVFLAFLLIAAIAYCGSLKVPYHFDDSHTIQGNLSVQSLTRIPSFFTDASTFSALPENQSYRPLTSVIFAVSYAIAGGRTWPFHIVKILMHAICCLFVFLIWRELFSFPGWFPQTSEGRPQIALWRRTLEIGPEEAALGLALLFAVHPANTETVTYISANTHLQASLFYLCAFWLFLKQRAEAPSRQWKWVAATAAAYICSVLTKEEGMTFPASAALAAFMLTPAKALKPRLLEAVRRTWPYWILFIVLAAFLHEMTPASWTKSRGTIPMSEYFMTQWRAWLLYLRLWFWPTDLNADNVGFGFNAHLSDPQVIQAVIGNLLIGAFAWWNRKRFPALIFGLMWFLITISPASSIVPLSEPVNEHRMYLGYVGFTGGAFAVFAWFFWGALKPGPSPRWTTAIAVVLFFGALGGTLQRVGVWQTSEALWKDTVEKNPSSGRALNNLALVYMGRGDYQQALTLLDRCEAAWTRYVYCPINKGIIFMAEKDGPQAEKSLLRAYELDPENIFINLNLGKFYQSMKVDAPKAISFYEHVEKLSAGRSIDAKAYMGEIYLSLGDANDRTRARQLAAEIRTLDPKNDIAQDFLGQVDRLPSGS
jgi:protein O-mannosyl-transferase